MPVRKPVSCLPVFAFAAVGLFGAGTARAQAYVGPESCKACHQAAYQVWKGTAHARAAGALTGRAARDGRCLSCHSPQGEKGLASVTCETCHGAGQYYEPPYVMKDGELARDVGLQDPGEKGCRACHDASSPSLKPFDFKEKLKLIDHWSADRAARQARSIEAEKLLEKALGMRSGNGHGRRPVARSR